MLRIHDRYTPIAALAAAGGAAPPLDGVANVSGAWSMSRDLSTSFIGGSRYTDVSGAVSSLNDQSGNSRHLTDGAVSTVRPAVSTAGPNSKTCMDFDGTSDVLRGGQISNFFTASAWYLLVSFIIDAVTANSVNPYENEPILGDSGGFMGLYIRNTTGTPETAQAFNWDGAAKVATAAAVDVATAYVVEAWLDGGNVFVCVNNGTPQSVASGNLTTLTGTLGLGFGYTGSGERLDGKVFEAFTATAVPASRSTIAADFMSWIGAV